MSVAKEEALSPDELRKRLYQTFKNRGVLDTLKTQLRNQLIQELKHPVLSGERVPRLVPVKSDSVLVTASNSLVADHLRNSGYEYTLSVFYPECGLGKDKIFSAKDLLQLMKISPQSSLYTSLTSFPLKDNKGFLMSLLIQLTDHYLHGKQCDADTQTVTLPAYKDSLVDKMKTIDEEYEALRYKGDRWVSYESKLAAYRKEIEAQVQAEMNAKLQHFKDLEIAKVKMVEKEKSHKEMLKLRQDLERAYEMKSESLITREKNAIDRLQKQQEIEEKDIYMQRQAVLKEIESVRNREAELRLRMEAFERTCKIQEDKTKTVEDLLRRRELAVRTMEDTYDQKLKNELSRYQLELKEEYIKRTEKLTENENRNKVVSVRIERDSAEVSAKLEEHNRACAELRRLQSELDTSQSRSSLLTQQNELLRERLEATKDYPTLKRERGELQAQVRLLNKQLEEAQEENQRLRADLSRPSAEQLALQTELRRLESAKRLLEEEFDSHRQVLQAQLQSELERSAQYKTQLLDCEERAQWMANHVEDIKMQLRQTQLALENEVLRNPKPSLVDRSVLDFSPHKLQPPDIYVDRGVLRAGPAGHDDACEAGVVPFRGRRPRRGRSNSPDSDTELLASAKARIRELEEEAETLEEAYRAYQRRALRATMHHMLPPRPLSPQREPGPLRTRSPLRQPVDQQRSHSPQRQQASQRPPSHSPQHPWVCRRPLSPERHPPTQSSRSPTYPQARTSGPTYPQARTSSPTYPQARTSSPTYPQAGTSSPTYTQARTSSPTYALAGTSSPTYPQAGTSSPTYPQVGTRRPTSPQATTRALTSPQPRTRIPISPQARVTFAEEQVQHQYPGSGNGRDLHTLDVSEARFSGDQSPQEDSSPPPRRLSSTPLSLSRSHPEPVEEAEVSSLVFPERQRSPLPPPHREVPSSGDFISELSPHCSPQLQSTARDQCSPPQVPQSIFSSSESSPQPERISVADLTEPLSEPSHIPELLLDTVCAEEEAPNGPLTAPPSRAPWDLTGTQTRGEFQQILDESGRQEEEQQRWERERREREEKRQQEREEAQERELRELERLEQEKLLEERPRLDEVDEGRGEMEQPAEENTPSSDPLQKYMKMVMEQRQSQQAQSPAVRDEPELRSPNGLSLSEKDDSIAFSHEDVDDFW